MGDSKNIKLKATTKSSLAKSTPYFIKRLLRMPKIKKANAQFGHNVTFNQNNLFWYNRTLNFGDWIGPYLFEKINGSSPIYKEPKNEDIESVTLSVGSIINLTKRNAIIWGSGIMDKQTFFLKPHKTLAVRGPLTRKRFLEMGYDCPEVYGDPALLMPRYFNPEVEKTHEVGIIPHNIDLERITNLYKNVEGVKVISVLDSVENVISHMLSCKHIVSSSLHGVILGNVYKIPTAWVHFSLNLPGDDVKFYDYFLSIGMSDISGPIDLREASQLSNKELTDLPNKFPQPKNYPLIDEEALLKACPF